VSGSRGWIVARAHADSNRAQARGVNRNLQVIQAQRGVTDAIHAQTEAAWALADAQRQQNLLTQRGVGPVDQYRQALKNLSPPAQHFVKHLVSMHAQFKALRAQAGQELFPGLDRALSSLSRAMPMLGRLTERTGGVLGRNAAAAAGRFTTQNRQNDIEAMGRSGDKILNRLLRGASNLTAGLLDFMVAARPFTDWLTHTIYMGTEWVAKWSRGEAHERRVRQGPRGGASSP
jgi:hypothetical protein